ncbi:MAG: GMC family oxidoreductase, partial [Deltaproteobacteria bacterium]|nr:GMC family oxidoreductase [Deltaproteobacteria bacterium]
RVGAKNTLDQNYLYLAEGLGAEIRPETEVKAIRARSGGGYLLETKASFGRQKGTLTADNVVLSGGVMGTVPLLLAMKEDPEGLPRLSPRVGDLVRTNSEALFGIVSPDDRDDFSKGVAITSIVHTDDKSHIEPVRYGSGSGFFRTLLAPHSPAPTVAGRLGGALAKLAKNPVRWARAMTVRDFAKHSQVLLYMRTLEGSLSMRLGRGLRTGFSRGLVTKLERGEQPPEAFMEEATDLANRFAEKVGGVAVSLVTEIILGVPSTAHILGGCCMGDTAEEGVVDTAHRVFGYDGLYVIDGSAISANPGVNPSLTITALAERAMAQIPTK